MKTSMNKRYRVPVFKTILPTGASEERVTKDKQANKSIASIISDIKYCYDKDMERAFFYKRLLSYKDKTVKLKELVFGKPSNTSGSRFCNFYNSGRNGRVTFFTLTAMDIGQQKQWLKPQARSTFTFSSVFVTWSHLH